MSYIHPSWNYPAPSGLPMDHSMAYDPSMMPPPMMHPIDGYLYPHPPMEMVDYYHQPIMDYDEYTENLSRPRLTKEQVETLEAQFQAHPKPSSNVKRQLAAQTNLSLPRVANWFQNRRAKAKQQKRQEEFEKMQKAKTEAEEAARRKSEPENQQSESRPPSSAPKEESEQPPTPKQTSATPTPQNNTQSEPSTKGKHHKSKSEAAREATFASLQRALHAAQAARTRFSRKGSRSKPDAASEEEPISPTTMAPPTTNPKSHENKRQPVYNSGYPEWADIKEEPSWESSHSQPESNASFHPTSQTIPEVPNPSQSVQPNTNAYSGAQFQTEEWSDAHKEHMSPPDMRGNVGLGYNMRYQMQAPDISVSRRDSDALSGTLNGIGICGTESGMPALNRSGGSSWEKSGKELDLAARRKRPRPAAIGTSNTRSLAASTSMSSLSPTNRIPSSGAGNSMRHSKSAQSLNSRYAGVRKASAAQRSPLNFTFAESGSMKSSKAEMLRPSVSSTSLAPPTPLTPQDFQNFMPASPTDSNYCLSAHSTTQFFPTSQPMQVNIASPPTTPLDIYSPFTYQNVAPPMSAPAQVSTFPEYVSCDPVPISARSWADTGSLSSPEFHNGLQVPHSATVSPIGFDAVVEHTGQTFGMEPVSESPSLIYSIEDADLSGSMDERKQAEFRMHDFSEHQHDPHGYATHHMGSVHKPKAYTFANNTTPTNYP
ncbi:uncharacterized protein N7469_006821 [Penicillium citrinum]|uniref:Homeobox domain-containing protein n=2 Tax=Penicillium TaxID=5073 RepID=A0A9W9NV68_PENCI|nr:uncharacterized protein N7469_006821 [Penicillium citrinum]KAJ5226815.1 hypothetical protein N7469_006821 [Penicillium citrinum]KAJ5568728.1 hypothetical protein N7450_011214 [Penicillium hetheringtonii]